MVLWSTSTNFLKRIYFPIIKDARSESCIVHRSLQLIQCSTTCVNTSLRGSLFDDIMGLARLVLQVNYIIIKYYILFRICCIIPSLRNWSHYFLDSITNSQIIHSFLIKYKIHVLSWSETGNREPAVTSLKYEYWRNLKRTSICDCVETLWNIKLPTRFICGR